MSINTRAAAHDFRLRVVVALPVQHEPRTPAIDVVVPVRNEERDLDRNVRRLHRFLHQEFPFSSRITIADNASADATRDIAARLASELNDIRVLRINEKGRGRALAAAWMTSDARILAAIDLDRTVDLAVMARLVASVLGGRAEIAFGPGFEVLRSGFARRLVPRVVSRGRLFDAELALRAAQISISKAFAVRRGAIYAN